MVLTRPPGSRRDLRKSGGREAGGRSPAAHCSRRGAPPPPRLRPQPSRQLRIPGQGTCCTPARRPPSAHRTGCAIAGAGGKRSAWAWSLPSQPASQPARPPSGVPAAALRLPPPREPALLFPRRRAGGLGFYGARGGGVATMLPGSKHSFKVKQPLQDTGPQGPKSSDMSGKRSSNRSALRCIPGEFVQEEAAHVRKSLSSRDGERDIPGTLYCTNLRVAFLPDPSTDTEDSFSRPFLHSDYDVALPCIGRLVAVNSLTKAKVLTGASTLKFIPEELVVYCRDFRVLRFRFHESGLEPQAFRVTMAIAQAQESSGYEDAAWRSPENGQRSREEEQGGEEEPPTLLFETLCDWEAELRRLAGAGWRVSPVNERFDMATR
ncbi:hypothetical protein lerEdw1_011567 [Lerista edwardsae]|nr:hypothetical protein lerEdw1_011567 [Lerista edwardsae]